MTALVALLWLINVVLDSGGQLAFKAAAVEPEAGSTRMYWLHMAKRPWLWIGIGCYVFEFAAWLMFLSLIPLSDGVLLGSINIVAIMLAGRWLFDERLSRLRVLGICLISTGVAIVGLGG
jgi:drug/metabolite transporter (DMT)-like permease